MSPILSEASALVVLICLDPPLLSDLLARSLRLEGVEAVVCPTVDRRRQPREPRRFPLIISAGEVPADATADVVIVSRAGFADTVGTVEVRSAGGTSTVTVSGLDDLVALTLRVLPRLG